MADVGLGFQNMSDFGQFSGTTNDTLTISNTTLSNNNQPFRCIITSGTCSDTSNVAILIIDENANLKNISNEVLVSVYPNPSNTKLFIQTSNFTTMSNFSIRIDNTLGQQVYSTTLNQQKFTIDVSTWSGYGTYFLHLVDGNGNSVEIKKIILQ